jgi:hypothetical protein
MTGSKASEQAWPHEIYRDQELASVFCGRDLRVMSPIVRNADILVLESDWGEDLVDCKSARPFIEGFASALGITTVFRSFHTGRDLTHWLRQVFLSSRSPRVVYIATHGTRRCLHPSLSKKGLLLRDVVATAAKGTRRRPAKRGLLLGVCEIGNDLDGILAAARGRFAWAAGYEVEIPWVESMLTDIAFLNYLFAGRGVESSNGKRVVRANLGSVRTRSAERAASWLLDDFGVAEAFKFRAKNWRRAGRLVMERRR